MAFEESLDRANQLVGGRDVHERLHASAFAEPSITLFQQSLKSRSGFALVIAEPMTKDELSLYERLIAVKPDGLSRNAWAERAGLSRSVFTDIRNRDSAKHGTVKQLLDAIGLTFGEFEAGARQPEKETPDRSAFLALRGDDRPRDVPVVGTAECTDIDFESDKGQHAVETMQLTLDEVVDYARRPVALERKRDVYSIYFRGNSMAPRYEAGEMSYVDPSRPPAVRDYVVVQLRRPEGDEERTFIALAKRLVRQSATFIELEQFDPPVTFRVPREQVKHIHRIIPWDELIAF